MSVAIESDARPYIPATSGETRRRIELAAKRLFCRYGFQQTTLRKIAAASNLTPGAIYNHFVSKQEILYAVVREAHDGLDRDLDGALAGAEQDASSQLFAFVEAFVLRHTRLPEDAQVANREYQNLKQPLLDDITKQRRMTRDRLIGLIGRVCEEGQASPPALASHDDIKLIAIGILTLSIQVSSWYRPHGELSGQQIARAHAALALHMVGLKDIARFVRSARP